MARGTESRGVVLVLDDDPIVGELLSVVLAQAGFEALTPPDWASALELVTQRSVVAAVCDLQLGDSNGVEVLESLRQAAPGLRAVVMSGHPAWHVRSELDRVGTEAIVLQKPFRPADLVAALEQA